MFKCGGLFQEVNNAVVAYDALKCKKEENAISSTPKRWKEQGLLKYSIRKTFCKIQKHSVD